MEFEAAQKNQEAHMNGKFNTKSWPWWINEEIFIPTVITNFSPFSIKLLKIRVEIPATSVRAD